MLIMESMTHCFAMMPGWQPPSWQTEQGSNERKQNYGNWNSEL